MNKIALLISVFIMYFLRLTTNALAMVCTFTADDNNSGKYAFSAIGSDDDSEFSSSSCDGQYPSGINSWDDMKGKISTAELGDNVKSIEEAAFYKSSLTSISMPNVETIGGYAFDYASSLVHVDMPNATKLKDASFQNTSSLTSVNMQNVEWIGSGVFAGASSLANVDIPNLNYLGYNAFEQTDIAQLELPDSLTHIDGWAFNGMDKLKELIISDNLYTTYNPGFYYFPTNATINCQGDIELCRANFVHLFSSDDCPEGLTCSCTFECISPSLFQPATEAQCTGSNYYWSGESCNNRDDGVICSGGYAKINDNCVDPLKTFAKKHYTPAEAAQWLHDGNDNFVILTFKK